MDLHHIISDGGSLGIFINKLFTYYSKTLNGKRTEIIAYG
ncbi:condensation domain-containing protein [Bacillus cereus]